MSNCISAWPATTPESVSWNCKIICVISLIVIKSLILQSFLSVGRFHTKYERFCAHYVANYLKTKNRRSGIISAVDDTKQCPFHDDYDGYLHDCVANMRRLDGSIEPHPQYGPPVNLFAAKGTRKFWVKASTPVLGWGHLISCIHWWCSWPLVSLYARYFLFLVLDKVVCPFLVKYFEMPIWHPTCERTLDQLLDAQVDM